MATRQVFSESLIRPYQAASPAVVANSLPSYEFGLALNPPNRAMSSTSAKDTAQKSVYGAALRRSSLWAAARPKGPRGTRPAAVPTQPAVLPWAHETASEAVIAALAPPRPVRARRRSRPQARPPARPDLRRPDGRAGQGPPRRALRRRRQPRRTHLRSHATRHALRRRVVPSPRVPVSSAAYFHGARMITVALLNRLNRTTYPTSSPSLASDVRRNRSPRGTLRGVSDRSSDWGASVFGWALVGGAADPCRRW